MTSDIESSAAGETRTMYRSVPSNGFPCDFCDRFPVGWVRVRLPNRNLAGFRATEVYLVCDQHITLGEPVYPVREALRGE